MAMDFSDGDEFGESDNDALLFAATQLEASQSNANGDFEESPRPHKRRKTLPRMSEDFGIDDSIDDDALFAATLQSQYDAEYGAAGGKENRNEGNGTPPSVKKPRHHFFEPRVRMNMEKVVITQTQAAPIEASQPWQIRGPVYVKRRPQDPAENHEAMSPPPRPQPLQPVFRQTSRPAPAPAAPSKAPADDYLDNLPSDAFSSQDDGAKQPIYVSSQQRSPNRGQKLVAPLNGLRQTTLFGKGMANAPASQVNKRHAWPAAQRDEPPTHHELDSEGTKTWVYPTNLGKIRDYQYNIVHRGLFHNLLVALPTGLGKTFIAATVMLNWFRWTKNAQIIFVAPTKPLVAQQVDACFNIAGIPRSATTMLTGEINRKLRVSEWQDKRVFFMTPQTLINDLKSGFADPKRIVLLVVDEAHRATGAYAYVEVVKFLRRFNESFRVLALTATPGGDVEAVQKVIDGLEIARVEIRTEQSLDIREFSHTRDVEKEVFKISEEMDQLMQLYTKAVQPLLNIVVGMNAHWQKDPIMLTPFGCTQAMQKWAGSDAGRHANQGVKGMVFSIFSTLASLAHSMDLLKYHGVGPMYSSLRNFRDDTKKSKYRTQILTSDPFEKLMRLLAMWTADPDFTGHPKLARCREVILNHLMDVGEGQANPGAPSNTRIMVFAHYRDSAEEIARVLKKDSPLIRPHVFVGQSGAKNSEGMSQKVQLDVIDKFKKGTYNVLIATSIGEEGLDIGEVDLIICYDSKASPLRMLQRMGRTGRKRAGRIVLFQMEGKEENDAAKAKDSYEHMQGIIAAGDRFTFHDDKNRRILPKLIEPVVDKRAVEIPIENTQRDSLPVPTAKGRGKLPKLPPKKFHMPDNARKGFTTAARMDDEDDDGSDIRRLLGKTKTKAKSEPKSEPKIETVVPPIHTQTYLNDAENNTLQSLYLKTCDEDEEIVIGMPDFTKHPGRQRKLGHTGSIQHGRLSSELVRTMERIHAIDEIEASRMLHLGEDECLDFLDESALIADRPASPMWEDDDGIEPETAKKRRVSAIKKPAKSRSVAPKTTKATKGPAERRSLPDSPAEDRLPEPAKKPRGRPPKKKAASPNEVHAQTEDQSPPAKAASKKAPKPRKAPAPRRGRIPRSPGEADEAPASSAPRSDPFMARATQGFDIGSDDTDDERDAQEDQGDYRDDSDLASFIAEDDEAIAVRSSSVPRPSFDRTPGSARPKTTKLKRARQVAGFILSDAEEEDEETIFSDDEPVRHKPKKRRVVESDDGSDD